MVFGGTHLPLAKRSATVGGRALAGKGGKDGFREGGRRQERKWRDAAD